MKIIANGRDGFLAQLPKNSIVAEIGVFKCQNAKKILEICKPQELHLIDPWEKYWEKNRPTFEYEFGYKEALRLSVQYNGIHVHKMLSLEAVNNFPDKYFDFIYIDALHKYELVKQDFVAWYPKIKTGGYLCGHDYNNEPKILAKGFGVKAAADDFAKEHGLQVDFISDVPLATDFAILIQG